MVNMINIFIILPIVAFKHHAILYYMIIQTHKMSMFSILMAIHFMDIMLIHQVVLKIYHTRFQMQHFIILHIHQNVLLIPDRMEKNILYVELMGLILQQVIMEYYLG